MKIPCPEHVVFSPNGDSAYVSYQCAPSLGSSYSYIAPGHDPIVKFNTNNDSIAAVVEPKVGTETFPNVGGPLAISPDGSQLWELGNDACSLDTYDNKGCGTKGPGTGVFNVIDTYTNHVVATRTFPAKDRCNPRMDVSLARMSFFPDGKQLAVTTGSYILFFNPETFEPYKYKVPGIQQGSNIVFKRDLSAAYVSAPNESRVRMLNVYATLASRSREVLWAYLHQWSTEPFKEVGKHSALLFAAFVMVYFGSAVSVRFATFAVTFADLLPGFSRILAADLYLRPRGGILVRVYCDQFGRSVEERLRGATLVPLPLTVAPIDQGVEGNPISYTSDKWCSTLIETLRSADSIRIGLRARSGAGKTILSLQLVRMLIREEFVPVVLDGTDFSRELGTFETWVARRMSEFGAKAEARLWRTLPHIVYLVDRASEAPETSQREFWQMLAKAANPGGEARKIIVAGRFVGFRSTDEKVDFPVDYTMRVEFPNLKDADVRRIGAAHFDAPEECDEIKNLPEAMHTIMNHPTPFVVSQYARLRKTSSRQAINLDGLFEAILDSHVASGGTSVLPAVMREILEELVRMNKITTGKPGLPERRTLMEQAANAIEKLRLRSIYGASNVPTAARFLDVLMPSGLIERTPQGFLFFHDYFEDWLAGELTEPRAAA